MMNPVKLYPLAIASFFLLSEKMLAQNTTSPYSILGIGDIETKDFGRWYGMGSTSIALTSPFYVNASNPASLMGLNERMMNFDIANRGKNTRFKYPTADTTTGSSKDMSIRRISLAFKPNKKWAFSVGLKPYSTINYLLNQAGNSYKNAGVLTKTVDGSGGLNQVYLSYAKQIGKHLSVGLTSSYYFGSANIKTEYAGDDLTLSLIRQEYKIMTAYQFQFGLQYSFKTSEDVKHRFGLTISNPSAVQQRIETEYLSNDVSIQKTNSSLKDFKLPLSAGVGYGIIFDDDITVSADAVYNNWSKQKLDYPNAYTTSSGRVSLGIEYSHKRRINSYSIENWYIQAGINAEKNYFSIQNNPLNTYAVSLGFGKNISSMISFYTGFEAGTRGTTSFNQIKETFNQYVIGFTLKEYWFNYKKYGRYQ